MSLPQQIKPMPSNLLVTLGIKVRELRKNKQMTRRMLASKSSISERYLAELEQGRGNISILLLERLAEALDTEMFQLLNYVANQTAETRLIMELLRKLSHEEQKIALQTLYKRFAIPYSSKQRIALIGLRGAGKTTLGKMLADQLDFSFINLTDVIEDLAGMNMSEIFSLSGTIGYRRLEEQALYETLQNNEKCIIETGGGIVSQLQLLNTLLSTCFVIWPKTSPEQYMKRVIDQGDLRPMLNHPDAMSNLRHLLEEREPSYGKADATLNTFNQIPSESLASLIELLPKNLATIQKNHQTNPLSI